MPLTSDALLSAPSALRPLTPERSVMASASGVWFLSQVTLMDTAAETPLNLLAGESRKSTSGVPSA